MGRCVWAVELNLSLTIVRQGVGLSVLANSLAPTVRCQRRSLSLGFLLNPCLCQYFEGYNKIVIVKV